MPPDGHIAEIHLILAAECATWCILPHKSQQGSLMWSLAFGRTEACFGMQGRAGMSRALPRRNRSNLLRRKRTPSAKTLNQD